MDALASLPDFMRGEFLTSNTLPWQIIVVRVAGAVLFCGLVGFEREVDQRPAGLRTHILVGLASCVYCIVALEMFEDVTQRTDTPPADPIRVVEAVTAGVAFLAAGLVVFTRGRMRGLKTGATMWLSAAIGVSCGVGLWLLAVLTTVAALVVIVAIRAVERKAGTYMPGHAGDSADSGRDER